MEITVMDFSGIYEREPWMAGQKESRISFRGLSGTGGYCTEEAAACIRERISGRTAEGVHFLDSGNYHYLTGFWLEKLREPFELAVFDHHSDMQPPALLPLLSCGNWLLETLKGNCYLQRVWLIGPPEETVKEIPPEGKTSKLTAISGRAPELLSELRKEKSPEYPVYLSVDKDILRAEEAPVNWDQGSLPLEGLLGLLSYFFERVPVLGADICGEPSDSGAGTEEDCLLNDRVNRRLAQFLLHHMEAQKREREERTESNGV